MRYKVTLLHITHIVLRLLLCPQVNVRKATLKE